MKINIYFFRFTVYNCYNSHTILSATALGQSEQILNVRQALLPGEIEVELSLSVWLGQWKFCLFIFLVYVMYDSPESAATAIRIRTLIPFCPALCLEALMWKRGSFGRWGWMQFSAVSDLLSPVARGFVVQVHMCRHIIHTSVSGLQWRGSCDKNCSFLLHSFCCHFRWQQSVIKSSLWVI